MTKFLLSLFHQKVKALCILAFSFGFFINGLAQIVYNDINPDFTTTMSTAQGAAMNLRPIDFNGDGAAEYTFRWDDWGGGDWFMHMSQSIPNEMILKGNAVNPYGGRFLQPLNFDEIIDSSRNWGNSFPQPFIGEGTTDANFLGLGDKYIGTKFNIMGNIYYGWVLVNFSLVNNARVLTVKSYAYNSTPNQSLRAGQTTLLATDETMMQENLDIYPNPVADVINLKNNKNYDLVMSVSSSLGQKVKKEATVENNKIDVSDLEKGVYYLELKNKENSETRKIKFIKK